MQYLWTKNESKVNTEMTIYQYVKVLLCSIVTLIYLLFLLFGQYKVAYLVY